MLATFTQSFNLVLIAIGAAAFLAFLSGVLLITAAWKPRDEVAKEKRKKQYVPRYIV
jgi:hypothetical protein